MSLGTSPVFRFRLHTLDREFSCPENGGGDRNRSRVSDTLWNHSTDKDGEHGSCTNKLHLSDQAKQLQPRTLERRSHCSTPDRNRVPKQVESSQEDTPVALRTRSKAHSKDTVCMITKEAPQLALPVETEDLVRQLIKQADEHHIETNLKIQMIYDMQKSFSDQQEMVLKLRKELEELKMQMSPNDVAIRKQLVKATNKNVKSASQIEATPNQKGQSLDRPSIRLDRPKLHSSCSNESDGDKILESNSCLKKSEYNFLSPRTFAVIAGKSTETTKQAIVFGLSRYSSKSEESERKGHNLPNSPSPSDASVVSKDTNTVHFALRAKVNNPDSPGNSDASSNQGLEEQDTKERYRPNHDRSRFRVSSAPRAERRAARNRIEKALNHGSGSNELSSNHNRKRMSCDLYVGNLQFEADDKDLIKSIRPLCCPGRLQIEKASVPPGKGRNRGYGFITLSWPRDAPIDPADICTDLSGIVKVHSRPIYLCATDNATSSRSNDTSTASQDASNYSESEHDTSTASTAASDYSVPDYEDVKDSIKVKAYTCRTHYPKRRG